MRSSVAAIASPDRRDHADRRPGCRADASRSQVAGGSRSKRAPGWCCASFAGIDDGFGHPGASGGSGRVLAPGDDPHAADSVPRHRMFGGRSQGPLPPPRARRSPQARPRSEVSVPTSGRRPPLDEPLRRTGRGGAAQRDENHRECRFRPERSSHTTDDRSTVGAQSDSRPERILSGRAAVLMSQAPRASDPASAVELWPAGGPPEAEPRSATIGVMLNEAIDRLGEHSRLAPRGECSSTFARLRG